MLVVEARAQDIFTLRKSMLRSMVLHKATLLQRKLLMVPSPSLDHQQYIIIVKGMVHSLLVAGVPSTIMVRTTPQVVVLGTYLRYHVRPILLAQIILTVIKTHT